MDPVQVMDLQDRVQNILFLELLGIDHSVYNGDHDGLDVLAPEGFISDLNLGFEGLLSLNINQLYFQSDMLRFLFKQVLCHLQSQIIAVGIWNSLDHLHLEARVHQGVDELVNDVTLSHIDLHHHQWDLGHPLHTFEEFFVHYLLLIRHCDFAHIPTHCDCFCPFRWPIQKLCVHLNYCGSLSGQIIGLVQILLQLPIEPVIHCSHSLVLCEIFRHPALWVTDVQGQVVLCDQYLGADVSAILRCQMQRSVLEEILEVELELGYASVLSQLLFKDQGVELVDLHVLLLLEHCGPSSIEGRARVLLAE